MLSDSEARRTALHNARRMIAQGATEGELAALGRSPEVRVRAVVAGYSGTPLTTLLRLAHDESPDVRAGVARNQRPGIPVQVFEDLAKDRSVDVVYALIDNPNVPDGLIARLARHLHREYARAARVRLADAKKGIRPPMAEAPRLARTAGAQFHLAFTAPDPSRAEALDIILGGMRG